MKRASELVTGKLIGDAQRRGEWLTLVRALQEESQVEGGRLSGWVFHGTDEFAAEHIRQEGIKRSFAIVSDAKNNWTQTTASHFGTPNLAAFFAEDRIESLEDDSIELSIFGARLADLEEFGEFAVDGQMLDCPVPSRLSLDENDISSEWETSKKDWRACFDIFETVVVLADIPAQTLIEFKNINDLYAFLEHQRNSIASKKWNTP